MFTASTANWKTAIPVLQSALGRQSLELTLDSQANRQLVRFQITKALGFPALIPDFKTQGPELCAGANTYARQRACGANFLFAANG